MPIVTPVESLRSLNPFNVYAGMKGRLTELFVDIFEVKIIEAARSGRTSATTPPFRFSGIPELNDSDLDCIILSELERRFPGCRVVFSKSFGYTVDWQLFD